MGSGPFNAHSRGGGGRRFSPIRFSLTGAVSSSAIFAERLVRRAAKRKTLFNMCRGMVPASFIVASFPAMDGPSTAD
jgi:hypothetical protein